MWTIDFIPFPQSLDGQFDPINKKPFRVKQPSGAYF
jgi:hypothetical protein